MHYDALLIAIYFYNTVHNILIFHMHCVYAVFDTNQPWITSLWHKSLNGGYCLHTMVFI